MQCQARTRAISFARKLGAQEPRRPCGRGCMRRCAAKVCKRWRRTAKRCNAMRCNAKHEPGRSGSWGPPRPHFLQRKPGRSPHVGLGGQTRPPTCASGRHLGPGPPWAASRRAPSLGVPGRPAAASRDEAPVARESLRPRLSLLLGPPVRENRASPFVSEAIAAPLALPVASAPQRRLGRASRPPPPPPRTRTRTSAGSDASAGSAPFSLFFFFF